MRRLLLSLAALALVAAEGRPRSVDQIVIDKSDRTLELLNGPNTIMLVRDIRLGANPEKPKRVEGDERTPEGQYVISGRNPRSRYHLALRVSYPNARDRALAGSVGSSPGGDIMIHGQPNLSPLKRLDWDWTDGCIAVTNAEMDRIWRLVTIGTPIVIRP